MLHFGAESANFKNKCIWIISLKIGRGLLNKSEIFDCWINLQLTSLKKPIDRLKAFVFWERTAESSRWYFRWCRAAMMNMGRRSKRLNPMLGRCIHARQILCHCRRWWFWSALIFTDSLSSIFKCRDFEVYRTFGCHGRCGQSPQTDSPVWTRLLWGHHTPVERWCAH